MKAEKYIRYYKPLGTKVLILPKPLKDKTDTCIILPPNVKSTKDRTYREGVVLKKGNSVNLVNVRDVVCYPEGTYKTIVFINNVEMHIIEQQLIIYTK